MAPVLVVEGVGRNLVFMVSRYHATLPRTPTFVAHPRTPSRPARSRRISSRPPAMPFDIHPADDAARQWAVELMCRSNPWQALGLEPAQLDAACRRPGSTLYVAADEGRPVGFILLQRHGVASAPYVQSIGVAPDARGRGVGTALLGFAESLYESDARWLFICVSSFNTRARALYQRLGYAAVAELEGHLVDEASEVLMRKPLRTSAT
ncbi:MAG: GNAT family N-acetyltransferase [Vicinamibacterales bacterium]